jgi:hypothetical protein
VCRKVVPIERIIEEAETSDDIFVDPENVIEVENLEETSDDGEEDSEQA